MESEDVQQPTVGRIVHVIRTQTCYMAACVAVGEDGPLFKLIAPKGSGVDGEERVEPYNPLHSARPTSGWHWPQEHNETS
jgi:hypothetical protein